MFEKIKEVLCKDYDHEIPDIPRSKDFARAYKSEVSRQVKPYGYSIKSFRGNGCYCTGFVTDNNGHYVYFNSGDFRFDPIYDKVLIRTAKSEKDYTGGGNHWCSLENIGKEINFLMGRG